MTARKGHARPRSTSLDDDRTALGAWRNIQRTLDLKIRTLVMGLVHFFRIGEGHAVSVHNQRITFPAVPQLVADLHVFLGPGVPFLLR